MYIEKNFLPTGGLIDHLLLIGSRKKKKTHTRKNGPRMGFFDFGKAHTGPL